MDETRRSARDGRASSFGIAATEAAGIESAADSRKDRLASTLEARRLELWRHWERKLPNNPFVLRQLAEL